jgi:hypothetical protein
MCRGIQIIVDKSVRSFFLPVTFRPLKPQVIAWQMAEKMVLIDVMEITSDRKKSY